MIGTLGEQYGTHAFQSIGVDPLPRTAAGQTQNTTGLNMSDRSLHVVCASCATVMSGNFQILIGIEEANALGGPFTAVPNRTYPNFFNNSTPGKQLWIFTDWKHPDRKKYARLKMVVDSGGGIFTVSVNHCAINAGSGDVRSPFGTIIV